MLKLNIKLSFSHYQKKILKDTINQVQKIYRISLKFFKLKPLSL